MDSKYRLHVIANPLIPTSTKYCTDAFTQLAIKFCKMFHKNNHTIYYYGVKECKQNVDCTKYINILSLDNYEEAIKKSNDFSNPMYLVAGVETFKDIHSELYLNFLAGLQYELKVNYKKGDIIVHTWSCYSANKFEKDMIHVLCNNMGGWINAA